MTPSDYNDFHKSIFDPFGEAPTDPDEVRSIQEELGVSVDGYLGPETVDAMASSRGCEGIVVGPDRVSIDGYPVWTYLEDFEWGETASRTRKDDVKQIIIHYDVSFNAKATNKILEDQGYSTHFIIDGDEDATIYQCHNPATKVAMHAGEPNSYSIGIDLNNPASPKYLEEDKERRGRERPVLTDTVHGSPVERLGYFDEQIGALNALLDALCDAFEVPRKAPSNPNGSVRQEVIHNARNFEGILGHYHWDTHKTDPAPLNWEDVV